MASFVLDWRWLCRASQPIRECVLSEIARSSTHIDGRWSPLSRWLTDERLRVLEVLLDEAFRIPGTNIRFGLDGIIGLVPGLGDVLAGLLSLVIPLAAWVRGVAWVTLVRMVANLAIGVVVGSIPLLGDAFDIWWKPNRRNFALLTRSLGAPHRHRGWDWLFLAALGLAVGVLFALPLVVLWALVAWLLHGVAVFAH